MIDEQNQRVVPVYDGPESTLLSWNGTCPESPNGERLTYFRQIRPADEGGETVPGEVWVCDADLTHHRKVFEMTMACSGFQHNGAMASWIDDRRIVFRQTLENATIVYKEPAKIYVVDVDTGEVLHVPITGSLGHYPVNHKIPFGVYPRHREQNPDYPGIDQEGLYILDSDTGEVHRILSTEDVLTFVRAQGFTPVPATRRMAHEMLNPAGTHVMARLELQECLSLISSAADGTEMQLFPYKPLHQLWFDNETYYGVAGASSHRQSTREICRWKRDGTKVETLVPSDGKANIGNHIDASPDREWYVTEPNYHTTPITINLYRRGVTDPVATLAEHAYARPTWTLGAHANPVFSRDGKRVYFVHAVGENKVQASLVDVSEIVDPTRR